MARRGSKSEAEDSVELGLGTEKSGSFVGEAVHGAGPQKMNGCSEKKWSIEERGRGAPSAHSKLRAEKRG